MNIFRRSTVADRPLSCREVGKVLQSYLDGATDQVTADRVADHLEDCRRCGMEAEVYREIKASLARQAPEVPDLALRRLRAFGEQLAQHGEEHEDDPDSPA